jgi:hypothetical protein
MISLGMNIQMLHSMKNGVRSYNVVHPNENLSEILSGVSHHTKPGEEGTSWTVKIVGIAGIYLS